MPRTEVHIAPATVSPIRLQEYGVGLFTLAPTKSALKKVLKKGWVTVDGSVASTATFIRGGETIKLTLPEAAKPGKQLIFPLRVLFEDDHLAVIHKPAGILVSGNSFKTITNALPQNLRPSNQQDTTVPRPVHRLDYATTGVLLVGKTNRSIRALNQLFADKRVAKTYLAVTIGEMESAGTINTPIDGKPASSHYEVCATVASLRFAQLNLVTLRPQTGRRHQLRKHLSGIGNPILGDKDYGTPGLVLNGKGLFLHAISLGFQHPFTREMVHIQADAPKRFEKLFPNFR